MTWQDLGQIFDAKKHGLNYTKSPQAVVFDDYVRVYFTACRPDNGKLISYVCYADFDKDFAGVLRVSTNVLRDGKLGCYDEHGVFPFSPVRVGNEIYGYISGITRRVSVDVDSGIGLCISKDGGEAFERIGDGPVVTSSLHEPFLVIDGFVRQYNGAFHMWYIYGDDWIQFKDDIPPDRVYKITHAVSNDGINWKKDNRQIICDKLEYESQALPTVIERNGVYHMMFCYRHSYDFRTNSARSYRLGYASSRDLIHWERDDSKAFASGEPWASEMVCYPNLFECGGEVYLLYNGNNFGKYGFGLAHCCIT